jgi:hypothetical protein
MIRSVLTKDCAIEHYEPTAIIASHNSYWLVILPLLVRLAVWRRGVGCLICPL